MSAPSTPRSEVTTMQARAAVCLTLDGGTEAMREAKETYLPKWKAEAARAAVWLKAYQEAHPEVVDLEA